VIVVGAIKTEVNDFTRQQLQFRVAVSDIRPAAPADGAVRQEASAVQAALAGAFPRRPFPVAGPISVAVVCSRASRVLADFVGGLGAGFTVREVHANMLDAASLAAAIDEADADVLAVVRGGGSPEEFGVFADVRVLEVLGRYRGYRVLAVGHSGDRTLADLVADYSADVPALAGQHVREMRERRPVRKRVVVWVAIVALVVGIVLGAALGRLRF